MRCRALLAVLILIPACNRQAGNNATAGGQRGSIAPSAGGEVLTLKLASSGASWKAPPKVSIDSSGWPSVHESDSKLAWECDVKVGGESIRIYLPRATAYATANDDSTGSGSDLFNTSTVILVDNDKDGVVTEGERWFANRPIRIGDTMFQVVRFANDGSEIEMKKLAGAPRGAVVGRKCPGFAYTDLDGNKVTPADFKGKAFLIDVWSTT